MLTNIDALEKELDTLNTREVCSNNKSLSFFFFYLIFFLKKVLNDELAVLLANEESFERQMMTIKNLVFVFVKIKN
mgnify:FL=1